MTLVCFSHLRWDFVFQRPQHLMSLLAQIHPVIFWEEPTLSAGGTAAGVIESSPAPNVTVVKPSLPEGLSPGETVAALRVLVDEYLAEAATDPLIRWYYTPMMLPFSRHIDAACTVYDCMDELANFRFAPPDLVGLEDELLDTADLVFTGGYSLYEVKRARHHAVHPFPSSVDAAHFGTARVAREDPADQASLARPRFGFYGVIDERMDLALLTAVADARPEWSLVIVGPVVKIDPADLPQRANIAYLGGKTYAELPAYAGGWDVALMPFAINESTRFISPTKTPEYLSAGLPVVSTPITDVVRHYGSLRAVGIADTSAAFIAACDAALAQSQQGAGAEWQREADLALAGQSWQHVAAAMQELMTTVVASAEPSSDDHYDQVMLAAPSQAA